MASRPGPPFLTALVLGAAALSVRLPGLGRESLWIDEAYSLRDALQITAHNRTRPLFYLLLRGWTRFGHDEAWLRLPALVLGVASVVLLYLLARRLFSEAVGRIAGMVMALASEDIDHAREVRMYTLATFLVLASAFALVRWWESRGRGWTWLIAFAAAAWLALLATPVVIFEIATSAACAAIAVKRDRRSFVSLAAVSLLLAALWLPWALATPEAVAKLNLPASANRLLHAPLRQLTGPSTGGPGPFAGGVFHALLAALCLALASAAMRTPSREPSRTTDEADAAWRRRALLAAGWYCAPWLTAIAIYSLDIARWHPRYLGPAAPGLYVWLGLGLAAVARRAPRAALATGTALFGLLATFAAYYHVVPHRQDWRGAVQLVANLGRMDDLVLLPAPADPLPAWRYYASAGTGSGDTPEASFVPLNPAAIVARCLPGRCTWVVLPLDPAIDAALRSLNRPLTVHALAGLHVYALGRMARTPL